MKYIFYAFILLILDTSIIRAEECLSLDSDIFTLSQRIDPHTYEVVGSNAYGYQHMILITHKAEFTNTGRIIGISVRSKGKRHISYANGFEGSMPVIEECQLLPLKNPVQYWPGMAIRKWTKEERSFFQKHPLVRPEVPFEIHVPCNSAYTFCPGGAK